MAVLARKRQTQKTLWPTCPHCTRPVLGVLPHVSCLRRLRCVGCGGLRTYKQTVCKACRERVEAFRKHFRKVRPAADRFPESHLEALARLAAVERPLFGGCGA